MRHGKAQQKALWKAGIGLWLSRVSQEQLYIMSSGWWGSRDLFTEKWSLSNALNTLVFQNLDKQKVNNLENYFLQKTKDYFLQKGIPGQCLENSSQPLLFICLLLPVHISSPPKAMFL